MSRIRAYREGANGRKFYVESPYVFGCEPERDTAARQYAARIPDTPKNRDFLELLGYTIEEIPE